MQKNDVTDVSLLRQTREYLAGAADNSAEQIQLDAAWIRFYHVYSGLIRRFALRCGVPPSELDDCVQDVWAEIVVALQSFRYDASRGRFRAWLYALVRSKATNQIRDRVRRTREHGSRIVELACQRESQQSEPPDAFSRTWHQETVHAVLAELQKHVSPQSYAVFRLRRIDERSVADVAQALKLTHEQVRARQHRMQRKFGRLYRRYTGTNSAATSRVDLRS